MRIAPLGCLLILSILCASPGEGGSVRSTENASLVNSDALTEETLLYIGPGIYKLSYSEKPVPLVEFEIFMIDGTGHLQRPFKRIPDPINPIGFVRNWAERIGFLTLNDAKSYWGSPRRLTIHGKSVFVFDAHSTNNGEENIYHLDLQFDANNSIDSYRVRGIGISNARWIDARYSPSARNKS